MIDKAAVEEKVKNLFIMIRSHFQTDGGDLYFVELTEDLIVKVQLMGACQGCSYRQTTLAGLRDVLLNEVPEVKGVELVD